MSKSSFSRKLSAMFHKKKRRGPLIDIGSTLRTLSDIDHAIDKGLSSNKQHYGGKQSKDDEDQD